MTGTAAFRAARDFLLAHRGGLRRGVRQFRVAGAGEFNWALDWFDVIAAGQRRARRSGSSRRTAPSRSSRSPRCPTGPTRWPSGCARRASARGDRVVLMLGNQVELWDTILAAMKLGAVLIPATPLLGPADAARPGGPRRRPARDRHVRRRRPSSRRSTASPGSRWATPVDGWLNFHAAYAGHAGFRPGRADPGERHAAALLHLRHDRPAQAGRAHPRLVPGRATCPRCTGSACAPATCTSTSPRRAGPSTPGATSSPPGTRRPACSSTTTPGSTRPRLLAEMQRCGVTSFCAPPTVWRMLIQSDLSALRTPPRLVVGAGEPLNPEVIEQVRQAWGVTIRDGFGQTETTVQIANTPGQTVKPGSMGRPVPGYSIALIDPVTGEHGRRGRDLPEARSAAARADGRLPRRRRS